LKKQHIVDQLIEERGQTLVKHPLWPFIRPMLYKVLYYDQAVRMADEVAEISGIECFEYISRLLELDVTVEGKENLPKDGAFILVSNHPTGIADGVAAYDMIKDTRPDLVFFANRDAIRVAAAFRDHHSGRVAHHREIARQEPRDAGAHQPRLLRRPRHHPVPVRPHRLLGEGPAERAPWQATGIQMAKRYRAGDPDAHERAQFQAVLPAVAPHAGTARHDGVPRAAEQEGPALQAWSIGKPIDPEVRWKATCRT
jgi:hypothetical protein